MAATRSSAAPAVSLLFKWGLQHKEISRRVVRRPIVCQCQNFQQLMTGMSLTQSRSIGYTFSTNRTICNRLGRKCMKLSVKVLLLGAILGPASFASVVTLVGSAGALSANDYYD